MPENTETPAKGGKEELLSLLKSRLSVAKAWAKKPHNSVKEFIREYEIEDLDDTDELRDKIKIGYIFRHTESDIPGIFDNQPELVISGRRSTADDIVGPVKSAYNYLWDIQDLEEKIENATVWFEVGGMGYIKSPWVTKTVKVEEEEPQQVMLEDGTMGENISKVVREVPTYDAPRAYVVNYFKLYFSPETKFAPQLSAENCPYLFEEVITTKEEIKATYGKDVDTNERLKLEDMDDWEGETDRNTQILADDLSRVTKYEYYGTLPKENAPDKELWSYDKEYHVVLTSSQLIKVEECEYPYYPYFILGNYGMSHKFWKFGDAKHLRPLQNELEKYRSQILEHTRKVANPKLLKPGASAINDAELRDPTPGSIVNYTGDAPSFLQPPQLGVEVGIGIKEVRQDLEKTSGSFDLSSGSSQSTVRTPRGISVFSEAADKNLRRKRKKVSRFIRQLLIFQLIQLGTYWKPEDEHTLSILGDSSQGQPNQIMPVTENILNIFRSVDNMYNLDIDTESVSLNKTQIRQDLLTLFDLAKENPDVFNREEIGKMILSRGFDVKQPDNFLTTPEQKKALAESSTPPIKKTVSVTADANTPAGAMLLELEGALPPGTAENVITETQQLVNSVKNAPNPEELSEIPQYGPGSVDLPPDQAMGGLPPSLTPGEDPLPPLNEEV